MLKEMYLFMVDNPHVFLGDAPASSAGASVDRLVVDFLAGMTDRYALDFYENHFLPKLDG